ncbi:MAG: protease inhibitor I42 family protein, partial [Treponema sp.]|nr:protease inhibitor I42 family protein [Treponema sp.]
LLIASCASGKAMDAEGKKVTVPDSVKGTGMEAVENGSTASISFDANATTGFSWDYILDEEGIVEEQSNEYVSEKHPKGMVGYGGRQNYTFKAAKAGSTTATFIYHRPWDESSTIHTVKVLIKVDKEGNIRLADIQ